MSAPAFSASAAAIAEARMVRLEKVRAHALDLAAIDARIVELGGEVEEEPAIAAVLYVLNRIQVDPDLAHHMLRTEAMHRLCLAEARRFGQELEEVRARREEDLQPSYRKRRPDLVVAREKLERLEGAIAELPPMAARELEEALERRAAERRSR